MTAVGQGLAVVHTPPSPVLQLRQEVPRRAQGRFHCQLHPQFQAQCNDLLYNALDQDAEAIHEVEALLAEDDVEEAKQVEAAKKSSLEDMEPAMAIAP